MQQTRVLLIDRMEHKDRFISYICNVQAGSFVIPKLATHR